MTPGAAFLMMIPMEIEKSEIFAKGADATKEEILRVAEILTEEAAIFEFVAKEL